MTGARVLTIPIVCAGLGASMLQAGDFSSYRGMQFGMNLSTAAKQAGTSPSEARTVHPQPAVIKGIDWQPRPPVLADPVKADPVKDGLLCFFNGELFRICHHLRSLQSRGDDGRRHDRWHFGDLRDRHET